METAKILEDMEVRRDGLRWEPTAKEKAELAQAIDGESFTVVKMDGWTDKQMRRSRCGPKIIHHRHDMQRS